jgi:hypothetical protein
MERPGGSLLLMGLRCVISMARPLHNRKARGANPFQITGLVVRERFSTNGSPAGVKPQPRGSPAYGGPVPPLSCCKSRVCPTKCWAGDRLRRTHPVNMWLFGCPHGGKTRTFLRFTLLAAADRRKRPTRWQAVINAQRCAGHLLTARSDVSGWEEPTGWNARPAPV